MINIIANNGFHMIRLWLPKFNKTCKRIATEIRQLSQVLQLSSN